MSLSRQDVVLGRALIAWGLVDRPRLVECAEEVRRITAAGRPITLAQVLIQRGLLSVERYHAIVARLRQLYMETSSAPAQAQQAIEQMPLLNPKGRYTTTFQVPRELEESSVDRAVQGWQQVANQVAAPGSNIEIEFDFSPPAPAGAASSRSAPRPAPTPPAGAEPPADRAKPDAMIRRRLKIPPDQERFPIGAWTVEQYLAEGAWGIVYRVTRGDGRPYALKLLKHLEPSPEVRQRFVQEARTMAKLTHPGIVHVHDAGVANGLLWFVMDFQPGPSLKKVLDDRGALPLAEGLSIVHRLCDAVAYAHENAVLHRDLKPDNIIMARGSEPILTDFGLAKDVQSGMNLTMEGQRIGTPLYMAPELLLEAVKATPQSEVYALGAILYQVLTGKVPFFAKSVMDLADKIEKGEMAPLRKGCPDAPRDLERLVARTLDKEPKKRPQRVTELRDALSKCVDPR